MRYLCRLVTPPGGVVLDSFAGSGSTGVACVAEGFRAVLVEQCPDNFNTCCARVGMAVLGC
jgi:site-specific DNA-methyltransferase (adenine-specific)